MSLGGTRRSPAICHSHYILHCTSLVYRTIIIWSCLTYHFNTISYNCRSRKYINLLKDDNEFVVSLEGGGGREGRRGGREWREVGGGREGRMEVG